MEIEMIDVYEVLRQELVNKLNYYDNDEPFRKHFMQYMIRLLQIALKRNDVNGVEMRVEFVKIFRIRFTAPNDVKYLLEYQYESGTSYKDFVLISHGSIKPGDERRVITHNFFYNQFLKIPMYDHLRFDNYFSLEKIDDKKPVFKLHSKDSIQVLIKQIEANI
jgi:hypothetical protein